VSLESCHSGERACERKKSFYFFLSDDDAVSAVTFPILFFGVFDCSILLLRLSPLLRHCEHLEMNI
jgi:hypothetical protein